MLHPTPLKNAALEPTRSAALRILAVILVALVVALYERRGAVSVSVPPATVEDGAPFAAEGAAVALAGSAREESAPRGDGGTGAADIAALRAARDAVRERTRRAFEEPAPTPPPLPARDPPPPLSDPSGTQGHATEADEDALGDMHGRWKALARDCYDHAAARRPGSRGKAAFHSVIVGDPAVGGVVESAELAEGSTIDDPELVGCLRESLLTLSFPPPRGGSWYRFDFQASFGGDAGLEPE